MLLDDMWWDEFWTSKEGKELKRIQNEREVTGEDWEKARLKIPDEFIKAFEGEVR